jgi:hypothetical protein
VVFELNQAEKIDVFKNNPIYKSRAEVEWHAFL